MGQEHRRVEATPQESRSTSLRVLTISCVVPQVRLHKSSSRASYLIDSCGLAHAPLPPRMRAGFYKWPRYNSEMEKQVIQKVVVYVIKDGQLLVFRHKDCSYEEVGIQVPAGSIKEGETPEAAAFRELQEETGYDCFKIIDPQPLGIEKYDMTPYRSEIQERHFFLAVPTAELPGRWDSQEDHDGAQPPTLLECFWIPLTSGHVLQSGQGAMLWKLSKQGRA